MQQRAALTGHSGCGRSAAGHHHHHLCPRLPAIPQHTHQHTSRQQQQLLHRRCATPSARAAASDASGQEAVSRLYEAMNARDAAAITATLAPSVSYANLALADTFQGQAAVAQFLQDSWGALPAEAQLLVEQQAGDAHAGSAAAVVWHLVLPSSNTTVSRGVSFFTVEASGFITSMLDAPEHPVKLSAAGLGTFGPLVSGLTGSMLPAVQQVSRALQDGANLLLQPLGSSPQQQPAPAPGPAVSSSPRSPSAAEAGGVPRTGLLPQLEQQRLATVAAAAAAVGEPSGAGAAPQDLSGLWVKVPERCDVEGYEAALDVLGLSGLQKVTARLIEGVEIRQTRSSFGVSFVTVVPFFKVTEEAPLDGGSSSQGRRDLRFGRQSAAAATTPDGGVEVTLTWGPPMAGSVVEHYSLLPDGCLCVAAETRVGDKAASSTTVYTHSQGSREQLLADSKQRNPSVAAVVQRQRNQGLRA